ncbi:MAG TPA: serine/threonine-protein kinase [Thermoanaerobaculia bacterium]|jgi:serine/threonine-protein kinase|nr:serine/threonine-protein kinase [Thermoanaerobaculia bacterium]
MTIPPFIARYRVDGEVGRGGMGIVYRAHDPELDREVAIKLISLPHDAAHEVRDELEKRFRREAKAAARVRHPGVVAIHDVGITETGLFLVMELVPGDSLAHRLERGAFPDRGAALELVARAAEALAAAHAAGLVHRDVKPANILLSPDGRVMLTDFGVARSLDEVSELTRTGMVVGSPAYMAPEQLQGAAVDGRTDLFSLGVVLYELLLRKRPFPAQSITTLLYQILHEDPLADPAILRELDPSTAAVLRRLLAKAPADRFPDAAAAAAAVRHLPLEALPIDETPTVPRLAAPPPPPALPPATTAGYTPQAAPRRSAALLWGGTAIAALVLVGVLVAWWNGKPERPTVQPRPSSGWTPGNAPLPEPSLLPSAPPSPTPLPLVAPPPALPTPTITAGPVGTPTAAPVATTAVPEATTTTVAPPTPPPPQRPSEPEPVQRLRCRKGVDFDVNPDEAEVFVNGVDVGNADDLGHYTFTAPGHYRIRLVYPGYKPAIVDVDVSPEADDKNVDLEVELEKVEG